MDHDSLRVSSWVSTLHALRRLDARTWLVALVLGALSALVIAIPTRLVPNELFRRMTPTRPLDYVFLVIASALIGLVLAVSRRSPDLVGGGRVLTGGLGTVLAVGCPVCNKLVVPALGVGGAVSVFAPLQPVLGAASIAILGVALKRRLEPREQAVCEVPSSSP